MVSFSSTSVGVVSSAPEWVVGAVANLLLSIRSMDLSVENCQPTAVSDGTQHVHGDVAEDVVVRLCLSTASSSRLAVELFVRANNAGSLGRHYICSEVLDAVGNILRFPSLATWEAHPFKLESPWDGLSECVYRAMVNVSRLWIVFSEVFNTDGSWQPASEVVISFACF